MSRVFIVQEVTRRDENGALRRVHDLSPAAVYGELVPLLGTDKPTLSPAPLVHEFKLKLRDFGDDDFLLAVGDPVAIGIAVAVAASMNRGHVKILKWNKEARAYIAVGVEL